MFRQKMIFRNTWNAGLKNAVKAQNQNTARKQFN